MSHFDKIPTKILLAIMFILLTGVVFLIKARNKPTTVEAGWWNEIWVYRNSISVTNNISEESSVYTTLSIGTSSLIGNSKLQADCGDLRFTDNSGNLLDYYLVSGCGTTATSVNVNHVTFPAGQQTIYYYYGNSSADNGTQTSNFSTEASNYSIGSTSSEEVTPGPIAYWKFDEGVGSTAYDSIGNNNGAISGAIWQTEDKCISGKCIYSNGNTINVNDSNSLDLSDQISLSFWWRPMTQHNGYAYQIINKSTGTADSNMSFYYFGDYGGTYPANQGSLLMYANAGGSWKGVSPTYKVTDNDLGEWMKIDFVYDSSLGGLLYINSQSVGSYTGSGALANNTAQLKIGNGTPENFFDEVKIYPYARTANQIKADYASGLAGMGGDSSVNIGGDSLGKTLSDGLVGYWNMDTGTGTTIADLSGNNNTGTFGTGDSAPSWNSGKYGIGINLDGANDYISVPSSAIKAGNEISISFWAHIDTVKTNSAFYFSDANGRIVNIHLLYSNGNTYWDCGVDGSGYDRISKTNPSPAITTEWHYWTFTKNSSTGTMNIYLDGQLWHTGTDKNKPITTPTSSGYFGSCGSIFFDGTLDEVRIYNRALSASEVKTLYNWAPGPVTYYNFNGNTNDISGSSINFSTSKSYTSGKFGEALIFEGGTVGTTPSTNILDTNNHTIEFWIQFTGYTSGWQAIFNYKPSGTDRSPGIWRHSSGRMLHWRYDPGNTGTDIYLDGLGSGIQFSDDTWYHITGIKDSSTFKAYVNGVGVGTVSVANPKTSGSSPYYFGSAEVNIDDVRIYNYARTQKQIMEDMNVRSGATKSTLPIAHWSFDEGYGTTANDSVGSNNGTFGTGNSAPSWTNNGKVNKALNFDGNNDYVSIGDTTISNPNQITATAWVKWDGTANEQEILGKWGSGGSSTTAYVLGVNSNGKLFSKIVNSTPTEVSVSDPANFTTTWTHVTVSYDGSNVKLYKNGVQIDSEPQTGNINFVSTPLYIGGITYTNLLPWDGLIDEVKIYNYALSEDEVKQGYNQGKTTVLGSLSTNTGTTAPNTSDSAKYCIPGDSTSCSPPIAEYTFDKIDSTYAYDTSGNGNNGTLGTGTSAPIYTPGKISNALNFDGINDKVSVPYNSVFDPGNDLTVEAWLYWDGSSGDNNYLTKENSYEFRVNGGYINYAITPWAWRGGTNATIAQDQWHHVTVTHDSDGLQKIYINGIQKHSESAGGAVVSNGNLITIGTRTAAPSFFGGQIDNVRVYNYARTPAQVAWDYNRGKPVAWWKFDECQGTTIHSSNDPYNSSLNGTLSIGASGTQTSVGTCTTSGAWANGSTGKLGASLNFDGTDDRVTISNNSETLMGTQDYAISAWVKTSDNNCGIYRDSGSWYNGPWLELTSGKIRAKFGWVDGSITTSNPTKTMADGNWHHAFVNYNRNGLMQTYVDGIPDASANISSHESDNINNSSSAWIGWALSFCDGQIDDVRVYNYALTTDQIKTLYNNGAVSFN